MKKLYRVTCEFDYFIVADDESDAYLTAKDEADKAFSDSSWDLMLSVEHVPTIERVPKEWRHCYPYGEDDTERTCEQILESPVSEECSDV